MSDKIDKIKDKEEIIDEEYIPQPEAEEEEPQYKPSTMKIVFGILMILIYFAMGYAVLFTNCFAVTIQIDWLRYLFGCVFAVYGLWRGYRQFFNKN